MSIFNKANKVFLLSLILYSCASYEKIRKPAHERIYHEIKKSTPEDFLTTLQFIHDHLDKEDKSDQLEAHVALLMNYRFEKTNLTTFDQDQILTGIMTIQAAHEYLEGFKNNLDERSKRIFELLVYTEQYLWELYSFNQKKLQKRVVSVEVNELFNNQRSTLPQSSKPLTRVRMLIKHRDVKSIKHYRLQYSLYMKLDELMRKKQNNKVTTYFNQTARRLTYYVKRRQPKNGRPLTPVELFELIDRYLKHNL